MMKFLLFNVVVVAALGFILYERGDLDGSRAGAAVSDARDFVHTTLKPTPVLVEEPISRLPDSNAQITRVRAPIQTPRIEKVPAQEPRSVPELTVDHPSAVDVPVKAQAQGASPVLQERPVNLVTRGAKTGPEIKPAPVVAVEQVASATLPQSRTEAAPRALVPSVSAEVEARRAEVLGTSAGSQPGQTSQAFQASQGAQGAQAAQGAQDRLKRLQNLAEEMEFLSVDLIYQ